MNPMDSENQRRTEELSAKVNRLKHLTIDMDKDLKEQNRFFNNMGFDFDSTGNMMKGSVNRVVGMVEAGRGNRKLMLYMVIILAVSFYVLFKLFSRVHS